MPDLAAFLAARLDQDEVANEDVHNAAECRSCWPMQMSCDCSYPVRVLREVAAKRAILDRHRPEPMRYIEAHRCPRDRAPWPCDEVRTLAAVYSDHPDYDPAWGLSAGTAAGIDLDADGPHVG